MDTSIEKVQEDNLDLSIINKAGQILRDGGLVAFPTETVYGLGGDALNPESSYKIYAAKGRPSDNPLIVHICRFEDIYEITESVSDDVKRLADIFWPGPLTMILKKSDKVPKQTTGGLDTVAVRMPSDKIALAMIEAAGGYVAAPSANTSGRPSPTTAEYVIQDMNGKIEMILDGGAVGIGLESTIVDMTSDTPMILRPGYITQQMLEDVLCKVDMDPTMFDIKADQAPKAPGMKYRHYAPKGSLTIIEGKDIPVIEYINQRSAEALRENKRVGIIAKDNSACKYTSGTVKNIGENADSIAHNLYRILREFDDEEVDVIFSESFENDGIGKAIMNRLLKAAGHQIIHV